MQFRGEHKFDITHGTVIFIGYEAGKRIVNYISEEALQDFFGAAEGEGADWLVDAFRRNQAAIEELAQVAITAGQINETGGANITSDWLQRRGYHQI